MRRRVVGMGLLGALPALTPAVLPGLFLAPWSAHAQGLDLGGTGPVEITATQGIEWRRDERIVVARGSARAERDGVVLRAERLIARYRDRPNAAATAGRGEDPGIGGGEIYRLEAEGSVVVTSATDRAEATRAVYDVDEAVLVLSGNRPTYRVGEDFVAADGSLEYWRDRRMAVARGAAEARADGRTLRAGILTAVFSEANAPRSNGGAAQPKAGSAPQRPVGGAPAPGQAATAQAGRRPVPGEGRITRIEAFEGVEILTATETVRGERAVYTPSSGIARLAGNVRILRGQNQLSGGVAEVDLRTGVSRLLPASDGAVVGRIVPERAPERRP